MASNPNRPACRFWASGKCSKGTRCNFYHQPRGGGGWNQGGGGGNNNNNRTTSKKKAAAIVKQDMRDTKHKIWPFTSYGMVGEPTILKGDFSMEEVRCMAYLANSQGQVPAHSQQLAAQLSTENQMWDAIAKDPYFFTKQNNNNNNNFNSGGGGGGW